MEWRISTFRTPPNGVGFARDGQRAAQRQGTYLGLRTQRRPCSGAARLRLACGSASKALRVRLSSAASGWSRDTEAATGVTLRSTRSTGIARCWAISTAVGGWPKATVRARRLRTTALALRDIYSG